MRIYFHIKYFIGDPAMCVVHGEIFQMKINFNTSLPYAAGKDVYFVKRDTHNNSLCLRFIIFFNVF